jgi:hypothetical protein
MIFKPIPIKPIPIKPSPISQHSGKEAHPHKPAFWCKNPLKPLPERKGRKSPSPLPGILLQVSTEAPSRKEGGKELDIKESLRFEEIHNNRSEVHRGFSLQL